MLPIDIPAIATELRVDVNSIFGRLYYHLDPLYGQEKDEKGRRKAFFMAMPGDDPDRVNFPLLEAVYAGLWQQRRRDLWTFWVAVISAGIAIGSLMVSIATARLRVGAPLVSERFASGPAHLLAQKTQ